MVTGYAKEELKKILQYAEPSDLEIIELKIVPGKTLSNNEEDRIEDIISSASQPSQILRQQRLRKNYICRYLRKLGYMVTQDHSKTDCIRICLEMWQAKNDEYLWKFRTADQIDAELDRLEANIKQSIRDLKHRLRENRPSAKELSAAIRCLDQMLLRIRSIGMASAMSSSPAGVSRQWSPSPSSSDSDSDASSSSSVEFIACSKRPSSPEYSTGLSSSSHLPSPMNSTELGSSQVQSSMDTTEPLSLHQPSSMNPAEPSVPPPTISSSIAEPSTSGLQFSTLSDVGVELRPAQPASSTPVSYPRTQPASSTPLSTAPRTRPASSTPLSTTPRTQPASSTPLSTPRTQPSQQSSHRSSQNFMEPSASRNDRQLSQTVLPDFFKQTRPGRVSKPSFKR